MHTLAATIGCIGLAFLHASAIEPPPPAQTVPDKIEIADGPFKPTYESLKLYKCPDWFRDAKLGIWAILTPQSLPEAGDWYARAMYAQGQGQYDFHVANYGHPSVFGYKDLAARWKLDKFDPDRLMRLYQKSGAKYFVVLANHHDNYDNWNSKYHRWNSVNVGPKKDIVGLWAEAARKHGLRFGVTEHVARSYSWFNTNKGSDKEGPLAGVPYDGNDPKFQDLYFPPHDDTSYTYPANPPEWWPRQWFWRMRDLIDTYQPDLMYSDGAVPFGEVDRSVFAHFYNANMAWHGGKLEAVYNFKDMAPRTDHGEYVDGIGVQDVERGVLGGIKAEPWQTDTCIGNWFYKTGLQYKPASQVIHMLADIVSKNGNLLLNIPLKHNGTIDPEAEKVLADLGDWMTVNGEAIYGTRPWKVFGEGLTQGGGHFNEDGQRYGARDIRFTTRGDDLYALVLGWPADGLVRVRSLARDAGTVTRVSLLGRDGELRWTQTQAGLEVQLPTQRAIEYAFALKIRGSGLRPAPLTAPLTGYAAESGKYVYSGEPKFAYGFSSHMVLQRDTNANVYGLAKPGTEVTVSIDSQKVAAKANEYGRWLVQVAPMKAGGPYILKLESGNTVVALDDVLIGDVWICAGQSNMRYMLGRKVGYTKNSAGNYTKTNQEDENTPRVFADELEAIRKQQNFPIRHAMGNDGKFDWVPVNYENSSDEKKYSPGITAVGYFFAKHLRQQLGDVPIGIIQVGSGGAAIREFLPRELQLADPGMKKILDSYWPKMVEEHGEKKLAFYYQQMGDWLQSGQFGTAPPEKYMGRLPGHLFYHALAPINKFSFKGFLYYQGESDAGRGYYYAHLLDKFVDFVRDAFEFSEMPFLVVLLPPSVRVGYADVVESQMYVAENKKGVHAVYAPEGQWDHPTDLHAPAKEIVGSRAALTALQKVYGGKEPYLGPRYAAHKVVGDTIIITFRDTGGGLALKTGVNELTGFEVAGDDENFISVKAKLAKEPDNVVLSVPKGLPDGQQLHVRFQMAGYYVPVLYGKNGLPAVFFRTDNFETRTSTSERVPGGYVRGKK
jgi:alpha-L-fucosidase